MLRPAGLRGAQRSAMRHMCGESEFRQSSVSNSCLAPASAVATPAAGSATVALPPAVLFDVDVSLLFEELFEAYSNPRRGRIPLMGGGRTRVGVGERCFRVF